MQAFVATHSIRVHVVNTQTINYGWIPQEWHASPAMSVADKLITFESDSQMANVTDSTDEAQLSLFDGGVTKDCGCTHAVNQAN